MLGRQRARDSGDGGRAQDVHRHRWRTGHPRRERCARPVKYHDAETREFELVERLVRPGPKAQTLVDFARHDACDRLHVGAQVSVNPRHADALVDNRDGDRDDDEHS